MSAPEDKQQDVERGGKARRTYASLECCYGFVVRGASRDDAVVSICPGAERTYWRHVGTGRPTAKDALYEKVEET